MAGRVEEAERTFESMCAAGVVRSHGSLGASSSLVAAPRSAGAKAIRGGGAQEPNDYTFTALILAYGTAGDVRGALGIRARMAAAGCAPTVHTYNALVAVCDGAGEYDRALALLAEMNSGSAAAQGIAPNAATRQLATQVGSHGASRVSSQQTQLAALSAAAAAIGAALIRAGLL